MNKFGQIELNQWLVNTMHYAAVCSGRSEGETESVFDAVRKVVSGLPANPSVRAVAVAFLTRATELMGPEREVPNEEIEPSHHVSVLKWTLMTLAVVRTALGKPFDQEKLEAEADHKIVARIQGNRIHRPNRHDLDLIVRRTLQWGLAELGGSPPA